MKFYEKSFLLIIVKFDKSNILKQELSVFFINFVIIYLINL